MQFCKHDHNKDNIIIISSSNKYKNISGAKATSAAMLGFKKSIDFGRQFRSLATLTAINLYVYEVSHFVQPYDVVKVSAKSIEAKMQSIISGRFRFRMSNVSMLFAIIYSRGQKKRRLFHIKINFLD